MGKAPATEKKLSAVPTATAPAPQGAGGEQHQSHKPHFSGGGKKKVDAPEGMCNAVGCKSHSSRFSFCGEHYEQFKFGLIKKTGELVPDYEKKFDHYRAMVAKRGGALKAA